MLLQRCSRLDPGRARRQAWAQHFFCAALVLLLILSEVFSSNIQATLPTLSHLARLGLTGGAVLLLGAKIVLLTDYQHRWQPVLAAAVLLYTAFAAWYGAVAIIAKMYTTNTMRNTTSVNRDSLR